MITADRSSKENKLLETRFNRLQSEYQALADTADQLSTDIQKKVSELKTRDDEISRLKQDGARLKGYFQTVKKMRQVCF